MTLKITIRNFLKHIKYNIINIIGISIGISMCTICFLFVHYEFSFNSHFKNQEDIYRVVRQDIIEDGEDIYSKGTSGNLARTIKDSCSSVLSVSRIFYCYVHVKQPDKIDVFDGTAVVVDKELVNIFSLKFVSGSYSTSFNKPFGVIITQEMANKIFKGEDPIGKPLNMQGFYFNNQLFEVTGVIENIPKNSSIRFDLLTNEGTSINHDFWDTWSHHAGYLPIQTYIQTKKNVDVNTLKDKINNLASQYIQSNVKYSLQPLSRIHLYSQKDYSLGSRGNITYLYIFITLSVLILIIVVINFINISSAQFYKRHVEVGIKKSYGSSTFNLIIQSLFETLIILVICLPVVLFFVNLSVPLFNNVADTNISLQYLFKSSTFISYVLLLIVLLLVIGFFPSLIFASIHPSALINKQTKLKNKKLGQYVLIVVQFAIVITLIILTFHINKQFQLLINKDLKFEKDNIVILTIFGEDEKLRNSIEEVKEIFLQHPQIIEATSSHEIIGTYAIQSNVIPEGKEEMYMYTVGVDADYIPFHGLKIMKGRNFIKYNEADDNAVILNQKAVDVLGWKDPIGKKFHFWEEDREVIGVVEDYYQMGLNNAIQPFFLQPLFPKNWLELKYSSGDFNEVSKFIKSKLLEIAPNIVPDYFFLSDILKDKYERERNIMRIFSVFSILTLIITCIGLFGLTTLIARQCIKEIGIRKVNGAKLYEILTLLNKGLFLWIATALLLAWPISWYILQKWLQNFAVSINISWYIFGLSGLLVFIIALLTVSWQSWRAATRNPVEALRYE